MFQDLRSLLERENVGADGMFTLVTETDLVDSTFFVNQLLVNHLSAGRAVCLLANTRSFHHYQEVSSKLGVHLKKFKDNGQLVCFETLKKENEALKQGLAASRSSEAGNWLPKLDLNVHSLYVKIKETVEKFEAENRPFTILVDDVSAWVSLGMASKDVVNFVQHCRKLTQGIELLGAMVAVAAVDSSGEDVDLNRLANHLIHLADMKVSIAELPTGYSKDVHGELALIRYNRKLKNDRTNDVKLHFKVEDKRVAVFPVGTSSAVL